MENKKNNNIFIIIAIIVLSICLIGTGYFMFQMISYHDDNSNLIDENDTNVKFDLSESVIKNILKITPVKLVNNDFRSYNVLDLDDRDINDSICVYINNHNDKITNENGVMLEQLKVESYLKFIGLNNYTIDFSKGNTDIRFKLEEYVENDVKYYLLRKNDIATDSFDVYEYRYLNEHSCNEDKLCSIRAEVVKYTGGGPTLKIGTVNIYVQQDDILNLKNVEFNQYEENIIE